MAKAWPVFTQGDWLRTSMVEAGDAELGMAASRAIDIKTHIAQTDRATALRTR